MGIQAPWHARVSRCPLVIALTLVATLMLSSCVGGADEGGPLDKPQDDVQVCGMVPEDGRMTAALSVLTNSGDTPVRITSIELRDPVNLSVVGTRVGAVDHTLIGLQYSYPPLELPEGVSWDATTEAVGATVPPAAASDATWNLVVGLQLADGVDSGRTDGIDVYYVVGERSFVFTTRTSIQLQRTKC